MIVEVKPIVAPKWHGRVGHEDFSVPKVYEVLFDTKTGQYATGLTDEEAEKYGELMGVDLKGNYKHSEPHPYWSSQAAQLKLPNETVTFNTETPSDFVKVKNLKASKFVANSLKEWEKGLYPEATHFISDEEEEDAILATKIQIKRKCSVIVSEMSLDEKANMAIILSGGDKVVPRNSQNKIDVELDKIIDEKPEKFLRFSQMDKTELYTRASVLEALHRNILTKEGTAVYYMSELIGYNTEEAIEWFMNPNNQAIKVAILEKLSV